jgi:hypothetical protein
MKLQQIGYYCYVCEKPVRRVKHFTAEDGRVLCYKCRVKEKAKPANSKGFVSAIGIKKDN